MSNSLIKDAIPVTDIAYNGLVPDILPGQPGYPGFPAWDEIVDRDTFGIVGSYPNPDYNPAAPASIDNNPLLYIYDVVHVHEVIHHPALPAVPTGQTFTVSYFLQYAFGWDAFAIGQHSSGADAQYKFYIRPTPIGIFTGLFEAKPGNTDTYGDYRNLDFGLRFDGDQYWVYELGVPVTVAATWVPGDQFTIRRLGREVAYHINTTLIYRSTRTSIAVLTPVAILFAAGDEVYDATFETLVSAAYAESTPAVVAITAPAPIVWAADVDGAVQITCPAPTIFASDDGNVSITAPAPTIAAFSDDFAGANLVAPVPTLSAQGGLIEPSYGIASITAPSLTVAAYGSLGDYSSVALTVPAPKVLSSDADGVVQITAPAPRVFAFDVADYTLITAVAPRTTASMDMQVLPDYFNLGIRVTAPMATAKLYGGGRIIAKAPLATVAIVASIPLGIQITAKAPRTTAALVVLAGETMTVSATAPMATAQAYGGARIVAAAPLAIFALVGQSGTAAAIVAYSPLPTVAVVGSVGAVLSITVTAILPVARSGNYITALAPMARALIVANAASYAVTDAYNLTLNSEVKPVTRFTNYPFHSIVRRGSQTIGFGPNGAFELAGADDNGTPIAWAVKFGPAIELPGNEFGQGVVKLNEGAYLNGRFTGTVTMSVSVDDGTTYTYAEVAPTAALNTMRFVPGKGLRGFAWQFGFSGTGAMTAYRAEFLQRSLKRKVRYGG